MTQNSLIAINDRLTLSQLESHLWEAANILRGSPVDRTDWKSYILSLLFFKRICDVWDEERADMVEQYGQVFTNDFRFRVPDDKCPTPCTEHTDGEPFVRAALVRLNLFKKEVAVLNPRASIHSRFFASQPFVTLSSRETCYGAYDVKVSVSITPTFVTT